MSMLTTPAGPRRIVNLPPRYEDEITGTGHHVHVHCRVCGATWDGLWEQHPRNEDEARESGRWERRPAYAGGVLFYAAKDGTEHAFRCHCDAGSATGLPVAPAWLWHAALKLADPTPGAPSRGSRVIRFAEVWA